MSTITDEMRETSRFHLFLGNGGYWSIVAVNTIICVWASLALTNDRSVRLTVIVVAVLIWCIALSVFIDDYFGKQKNGVSIKGILAWSVFLPIVMLFWSNFQGIREGMSGGWSDPEPVAGGLVGAAAYAIESGMWKSIITLGLISVLICFSAVTLDKYRIIIGHKAPPS